MQKLVEGIHRFQTEVFSDHRALFERLEGGQHPEALFITCSDSRINPNLLTQSDPGDLFTLRNAGNIVPAHGQSTGGEAATIEFAVAGLGVTDIIICGHTRCGAMAAMLEPARLESMPAVADWLHHADSTQRILKENYGHLNDEALATAAVEENVLVQLENLRTHPSVASALAGKRLHLHGWVYQMVTGQVFAYNSNRDQFEPLVSEG